MKMSRGIDQSDAVSGILYCPFLWEEKMDSLLDKMITFNDSQNFISDCLHQLYVMLLDLKFHSSDLAGNYVKLNWMSLADAVCLIFRGYLEDAADFPKPLFTIMLHLPDTLPYSHDIGPAFQKVINALCDHFEWQLDRLKQSVPSGKSKLSPVNGNDKSFNFTRDGGRLISTCEFLVAWCAAYGDILQDKDTLSRCLQVLDHLNSIFESDQLQYGDLLQNYCKKCQTLLKNLIHGLVSGDRQSEISERDLIQVWEQKFPNQEAKLRYLALDGDDILCLINPPRNEFGKRGIPIVYHINRNPHTNLSVHRLMYESYPLTEDPPPEKEKPPRPKGFPVRDEMPNATPVPCLDEIMTESVGKKVSRCSFKILQNSLKCGYTLMKEYVSEQQFIDFLENQKLKNKDLTEAPTPLGLEMPDPAENPDGSRMLLSHAGLLSPELFESNKLGKQTVVLLKNSPKLQADLKELDNLSHKNTQTVMVLYAKSGQKSIGEILQNNNVLSNRRFRDFVSALGDKIVDVRKTKRWKGLQFCDPTTFSPVMFPSYSDCINEIVFVTPNLFPSKELLKRAPANQKHDTVKVMTQEYLLENIMWHHNEVKSDSCRVFVIWTESTETIRDVSANTLASYFKFDPDSKICVIFAHPLTDGLVRISANLSSTWNNNQGIYRRNSPIVVRDAVSPSIVRERCLLLDYACTSAEPWTETFLNPRKVLIDKIIADHQCTDHENGYFNCFFGQFDQ